MLAEKILEAKTIIGNDAATIIAKHYGLEKFDETKMTACCPFHDDSNPSFKWNPKDFAFKCFPCGNRLGILDMYQETEGNFKKAVQRLFNETGISYSLKSFSTNKDDNDFFRNFNYPKEETNTEREAVNEYCARRGISEATLDYAGIKQNKYGDKIVFEHRDMDGILLSSKYRSIKEKDFTWQKGATYCPILFNIPKTDVTKPLLIVEGHLDALAVIEAGYTNVISIPNGAEDLKWIEFNYEYLSEFEQIILWFDNDSAGQKGMNGAISRLGEYRCKFVKPLKEHEDAVEQYYHKFVRQSIRKTDANNILLASDKQAVLNLINQAEEVPSKKLKYLMDCESINMEDIEKVSTGIRAFDRLTYGSLFPCFTIISGYAGGGKTSLSNLMYLLSTVDKGYKTFVFSGELGEGQLADWILTPFAGYNHIEERQNPSGDRPFYVVTEEAKKAIKEFYRKDMIVYSDSDGLCASGESLITEMEYAYKKYGCRVFLIDNLMCLNFDTKDEDSKWDTQKKFIISLMGFSEKYKACVNLIAHPKKPSIGAREASVYDLHGASELSNLCHRMFWVRKLNPKEQAYNVRIEVIKDRPSGASGYCDLFYDEKTKRVYSDLEELGRKYAWEDGFKLKYNEDVRRRIILPSFPTSLPDEVSSYNPPY
jgi:twinkle protein